MEPFLGRDVDDVLEVLGNPHHGYGSCAPGENIDVLQGPKTGKWYAGEASLEGTVRGKLSSVMYYPSAGGDWSFSGSMWTAPVLIKGGGVGEWARIPEVDEKMRFTWFGGSVGGGTVSILWSDSTKKIVGTLTIVTAGAGGGGGDGSGRWKRGR